MSTSKHSQKTMLLFRSEDHIDKWCRERNRPPGGILTLGQAWQLAQAWYSDDRREHAWRRKSPDEAERIFQGIGLVGPFWCLQG